MFVAQFFENTMKLPNEDEIVGIDKTLNNID